MPSFGDTPGPGPKQADTGSVRLQSLTPGFHPKLPGIPPTLNGTASILHRQDLQPGQAAPALGNSLPAAASIQQHDRGLGGPPGEPSPAPPISRHGSGETLGPGAAGATGEPQLPAGGRCRASSLQLLLEATQRHGTQGPAAALFVGAVAAAAVAHLRTGISSGSSSSSITNRKGSFCQPTLGQGHDASGAGTGDTDDAAAAATMRAVAGWLADVAADVTAPEPAARAALSALADLLTAALRVLLAAPPIVASPASQVAAAVAAAGAVGATGAAAPVGKSTPAASTAVAPTAAAAAALCEPRCDAVRLTAAAVSALYGRCADAAAVAAAARLLGCCLQLQLQLPPTPQGACSSFAALATLPPPPTSSSSSSWSREAGAATTTFDRPVGLTLSRAAGWDALLELRHHPHPLARTACMHALHQACAAAAGARGHAPTAPYGTAAAAAPSPPPSHLLDPAAAVAAYGAAIAGLEDDAEEPRAAAAALVSGLAVLVPDLPCGTHFGVAARLVDDGFMRLCGLVADPQRGLRLQALRALGGLHAASLRVKLQALSKKTILRVAAPPPPAAAAAAAASASAAAGASAQPTAAAPASGSGAGGKAPGGGGGGGRAGGKRSAADAAAAAATAQGADQGVSSSAAAKRLTASAWEPASSWLAAARSGSRSASGPGSRSGPGTAPSSAPGRGDAGGVGHGSGDGGNGGGGDLALLENAVGAFVLGSEDEHWEVRVATLEAMTTLAEYEYRSAAAAAAAAVPGGAATAAGPTGGAVSGADATATVPGLAPVPAAGGGGRGGAAAAAAAGGGAAPGLSVRIGGIGGSAGSRIASGGGNAEAAAAICDALVDALLDELPEVRQAAATGVLRLLTLEAKARKEVVPATAGEAAASSDIAAAAAAAPLQQQRRTLPALLNDESIRSLAAAARDTDGGTRRTVVRALGRLRLSRPALLREVVQALRRCVAANPTEPDWRAAAAAAWRLGAAAPAAAAASVRDLSPAPEELAAAAPPPPDAAGGAGGAGGGDPRQPPPPTVAGGPSAQSVAAAATAAGADPTFIWRPSALRRLRSDSVLRLLVLAGAFAVQPDAVAAALPSHLTGPLLAAVGRMYRP